MRVPFHKTKIDIGLEDILNIEQIIKSGQVVNGKWTEALEYHFKLATNVKHAITCANCTSGLMLALQIPTMMFQYKIAYPSFTWPSTRQAIWCSASDAASVDVDRETWLMKEIPEWADVAIVVDTFGNEVPRFETKKPVIYDAAHGYGLPNLGNRGLIEVVSLAMTKAVTGAQGGIILTNDDYVAEYLRKTVRMFAKISELHAYLALVSARSYAKDLERRFRAVEMYCNLIKVPYELQKIMHKTNLSVFAILLESQEKRDRIAKRFKNLGIEVKIYYEPLVVGHKNTDEIYSRILALPTWNGVESYIPELCSVINNA